MHTLRLAMAQINSTVGALSVNSDKIVRFAEKAHAEDCDLVVFPELALTGYPPEDLVLKPGFVDNNIEAMLKIAKEIHGVTAIIGYVDRQGDEIYNAAAIIHRGKIVGVYHKMFLPNYGVFDEERYFQSGISALNLTMEFGDGGEVTVGLGICEDIWYPDGPATLQALGGAHVIININASPYHYNKVRLREEMLTTRAVDNNVMIAYNNMVGGQDELVFDGNGMIIDERGRLIAKAKSFKEDLVVTDLHLEGVVRSRLESTRRKREKRQGQVQLLDRVKVHVPKRRKKRKPLLAASDNDVAKHGNNHDSIAEVYSALILGTKDYVRKNKFKQCVIGLSGGVDSALVAAIAVQAIGAQNIVAVFMPSRYTSRRSITDVRVIAKNLGIELFNIPIDPVFDGYLKTFGKIFRGLPQDVAEENMQARIRGNILMALSNKFGWLVLTTGNKSEMSVGYATLYGDMAGGFAVIKDVPKIMVYELCQYINDLNNHPLIPSTVLTRAPSAELRADQTDQDSLPPYEVLDPILKAYVEEDRTIEEIADMGFDRRVVKKIVELVDRSEYKRRQAPPGIKITPRAFGKDRRMPITNGYANR